MLPEIVLVTGAEAESIKAKYKPDTSPLLTFAKLPPEAYPGLE